ncbi:hypothetical protein EalM132_00054 [Exiguobacterium phage vB_EalM-132]|nr:hypothetical protein EalM132_00054 [Exiguobacterium phage vB_EalM-132]
MKISASEHVKLLVILAVTVIVLVLVTIIAYYGVEKSAQLETQLSTLQQEYDNLHDNYVSKSSESYEKDLVISRMDSEAKETSKLLAETEEELAVQRQKVHESEKTITALRNEIVSLKK